MNTSSVLQVERQSFICNGSNTGWRTHALQCPRDTFQHRHCRHTKKATARPHVFAGSVTKSQCSTTMENAIAKRAPSLVDVNFKLELVHTAVTLSTSWSRSTVTASESTGLSFQFSSVSTLPASEERSSVSTCVVDTATRGTTPLSFRTWRRYGKLPSV